MLLEEKDNALFCDSGIEGEIPWELGVQWDKIGVNDWTMNKRDLGGFHSDTMGLAPRASQLWAKEDIGSGV